MSVDDLSFSAFRAIAFGFGIRACFAVAAGVSVLGLVATAWRLTRKAGLVVLCVGATVAWVGMLTVSEVQTSERLSEIITARYHSFSDATRELAQIGLVALPACVWGVKALRDRQERARRRSLLSTYLRIATRAYLSGDFDRAIAEYSIAIKVDPKRTEIYVKRGLAWWQKGDYDRAIADFDRAMKLDPGLAPAYLHRGIVLAARGDHDRAIADFDRVTTLRPSDAAAVLCRGLSLAKQGETDRAAEDFRQVLKVTNHSDFVEPARFHLAMLEAEQATAAEASRSNGTRGRLTEEPLPHGRGSFFARRGPGLDRGEKQRAREQEGRRSSGSWVAPPSSCDGNSELGPLLSCGGTSALFAPFLRAFRDRQRMAAERPKRGASPRSRGARGRRERRRAGEAVQTGSARRPAPRPARPRGGSTWAGSRG